MMKVKLYYILLLLQIVVGIDGFAQSETISKKVLLRDSTDFKEQPIEVNSKGNEYAPIEYKGGLLYISDRPLIGAKVAFNKIYWTKDTAFKFIDAVNKTESSGRTISKYYDFTSKNHDFTPPTSNDNDILFNYKRVKNKWNNIELNFKHFTTNQAFAYNEQKDIIIYAKESVLKFGKKKRWELWEASLRLGKLYNRHKLSFKEKAADYLYPYLTTHSDTLFFSSNVNGGKGGYDIYYIVKQKGYWNYQLNSLNGLVNSSADELSPFLLNDTLYFSSNRDGGMGGFDSYTTLLSKPDYLKNLGYPLNSEKDEISLKKSSDGQYYLTTNRNMDFDILKLQYKPIYYDISGMVIYKSDSTLVRNHQLVLVDNDTRDIIDTIFTNNNAQFAFVGKPNRNYQFITLNGDSVLEYLSIATKANQVNLNYPLAISGRSPKQIKDSLQYIALSNQRKNDSILEMNLNNKFVVYFGFDKSILSKSEIRVLDSLLSRLKRDEKLNVVIGAFTDCIGSYKYNTILSNKRANNVVDYLIKRGLEKNRIISNGYSKNYSVIPCYTGKLIGQQKLNRRAEIVLSESKKDDWASLERKRGSQFYSVFSNNSSKKLLNIKKDTVVKVIVPIKKDTIAKVVKVIPPVKKDTVAKVIVPVKKDTIAKLIKVKLPVKKDTVAKVIVLIKKDTIAKVVKVIPPVKKDTVAKVIVPIKKDTIAKLIKVKPPVKKDTVAKVIVPIKKDSIAKVVKVIPPVKKDLVDTNTIVAKSSDYVDDISKEEILKALDSLANLKREQERIIEYLTKRINKKPIDVYVSSDSVTIEIYDNAIHDKDSVSIIYNNRIIVDKQELKVNKPIKFKLKVDKNKKYNELVMVAENLGSEPPNTAVMFVTEKSGRRQQVLLSTDMTHNELVYFIRIGKE